MAALLWFGLQVVSRKDFGFRIKLWKYVNDWLTKKRLIEKT